MFNSKRINFINNQAFTLIELIVVISLISILLAFAIPRLDNSFLTNNKRKLSSWIFLNVKSLKEKAVREQVQYTLIADIDNNRLWITTGIEFETDSELENEAEESPRLAEYKLPNGFLLMDVEFMNDEKVRSGIAEIHFYKKGYSDKAIIHIEDNDNNRFSYLIEPFLLHVKIDNQYVEF